MTNTGVQGGEREATDEAGLGAWEASGEAIESDLRACDMWEGEETSVHWQIESCEGTSSDSATEEDLGAQNDEEEAAESDLEACNTSGEAAE